MVQIQPADRAARKRAILVIGIVAGIGCLIILAFEWYRPTLEAFLLDEPERVKERLVWVLLVFIALSVVPLLGAIYVWRIGKTIIRARRFPPPGLAVVVDTPISTGAKAVWRGRLMQISALFLAACAVAGPAVVWWVSYRLLGDA